MAINKVDLTVSQIINDLNSGLTWLKKDDLGYGSIETKYNANALQIATIRKHPALKDAETSITIFNIIDDTKNAASNTSTKESSVEKPTSESRPNLVSVDSKSTTMASSTTSANAADIFASL
jgi:hypothetical protein